MVSLIIFVIYFLFSSLSVYAATIELSNPSASQISDINQEYQVHIKLNIDTTDGTNYYLRGVFYKEGSSNYCGYTYNGGDWFSGPYSKDEGWKKFLAVSIASNSAETLLKAKIDSLDSGCKESGDYKFKVQRFTKSGSGSFDSQNEQTIQVVIPSPTPTFVPTVYPTHTNVPSRVSVTTKPVKFVVNPTSQPSITEIKQSIEEEKNGEFIPTRTITDIKPSNTSEMYSDESTSASVLGVHSKNNNSVNNSKYVPIVLAIVSGLFFISGGIAFFMKIRRK